MRRAVFLMPFLLAACATTTPAAPGQPSTAACRNDSLAVFAGRDATPEVGSEIMRASGAKVLRWVQPGMAVTMDFREDRVTIWVAPGNKIERANCG